MPELARWYIDVGVESRQDLPVGIGDVGVLERPFVDQGARLIAGGFDDRVGCAILIEVLRLLQDTPHEVHFVFTVQEEVGVRGARVAAFGVEPEIGIAVDVTPAAGAPRPDLPLSVKLGAGPALKVMDVGMIAHVGLRRALEQTARAHDIPFQLDVMTLGSTDAAAIQSVRSGVITGAVSVPCRYTHTPSEMIDYMDVQNTVRLLLAFLAAPIVLL